VITAQGVHEDIEKIKWNIQTNPVKLHSQFAEILIHLTTIRAFEGGQPWTRSHCWHRISRLAFLLRRLELCLWTSRHLWHYLYGTAASQASCCNCYLIDTWSTWSMEMVGNHSFTLTSGNGKRSRLRRLRTASHRDLSWHPFSSTPTSLTCQPPSPKSIHVYADDLAIMQGMLMETGRQCQWKRCWARTWQP